MERVDDRTDEDPVLDWRELHEAEDEMLQHVKDVAQRISHRVRHVLGEWTDDELLAESRALDQLARQNGVESTVAP